MAPKKTNSAPLIKGYLPVRLKLSTKIDRLEDEAFLYVKEHQQTNGTAEEGKQKGSKTLFVCNTPAVPKIRTRLLLKSLFGRYGEVTRVTVVPNPRKDREECEVDPVATSLVSWTKTCKPPSFLPQTVSEGKFAHVVFESNKEMRKALKELCRLMMEKPVGGEMPGLSLDAIELQTLADETDRQLRELREELKDSDDSDDDDQKPKKGIMAVVDRYRASCSRLDRRTLLDECNSVIQEFEDSEERARKDRDSAMNEADEDGFVTVSYSAQVASKSELEETPVEATSASRRRKGQMRHRKKKKITGSSELSDFYRFQTKENRKRSVHELRERFEKDLAKVKKMKADGQYRPF